MYLANDIIQKSRLHKMNDRENDFHSEFAKILRSTLSDAFSKMSQKEYLLEILN